MTTKSLQWVKTGMGLESRITSHLWYRIHRNLDPSIPGRYVLDLITRDDSSRTVKKDRGLSFANDVRSLQFEAIELLAE